MARSSMRLSGGRVVAGACLLVGAAAQTFEAMEFVMPLYIAPTYPNGTIAAQWVTLHDTAQTGATVFGILNPASGPGTETAENYTETIDYVKTAGAKLLCYVATTYGAKSAAEVEAEIVAYQTLYNSACDGIFFDEAPYLLGDELALYAAHNTFAHDTLDSAETARIVFNTGQAADEQYFAFSPPAEVLGFENYYKTVRQLGLPETSSISVPSQNMLLLHSATELATKPELVASFVDKAYCKGWGTIYVTDDLFFEGGNPWDDPPSFWNEMVAASTNIPTVESCGLDGIKVLAPLFGSDPADYDAIIASGDPGDYGDKITVALNLEITADGEATTKAAEMRDAGIKILCYIDATGSDFTALEDAVTTFTYFPLNDICAGFFFGGFDVLTALEDVLALQSLYVKTQKTFLQATVVFAPGVVDTLDEGFGEGSFSYSYSYETEFYGFDDDWDQEDSDGIISAFYLPWEDALTESDVVALVEVLTMGLEDGATSGDIIVASTLDGADTIPIASGPTANTAAMVVGYSSSPETMVFDLFGKDWGYCYVTEFQDFEFLATQWSAVVTAAQDTDSFVST